MTRNYVRLLTVVLCFMFTTIACSNFFTNPTNSTSAPSGYNLPIPAKTGIVPLVGHYRFDAGSCFKVAKNASDVLYVVFASDCYRYDWILVVAGAFTREWGYVDKYNCPTDGYGIAGSFTSPTHAQGVVKYSAGCSLFSARSFTADWISP